MSDTSQPAEEAEKKKPAKREGYEVTEFERAEPTGNGRKFTPDQLLDRMGQAAWEYRQAIEGMRKLETAKNIREAKATVIITARRLDLLQNRKLADHIGRAYTETPTLKPTKEQIAAWVHVEHQAIFDEYLFWEAQAKQAEKDHEMWARQLSWYQSELKHEGIEMSTLRSQRG